MAQAPRKILVADDSLTIQKVIRLALGSGVSADTYQIQAVSDGNEAIQQISVFRPDVVLIDVALPSKSAFEVKHAIESGHEPHHPKFILMSSAFEKVDELAVGKAGFSGRLTKPFDPAHLRQVISEAIGSQNKIELNTNFPPPLPSVEPEEFNLVPPPPPASEFEMGTDTDIKRLTESTLKMSGLSERDDFDWNVNEPSIKPLPAMEDDGGTNFRIQGMDQSTPSLELDFPSDSISAPESLHASHTPPPPPAFPGAFNPTVPANEVEQLTREEIQKELQKILPDLAEKLIRNEIRKMLMEQP